MSSQIFLSVSKFKTFKSPDWSKEATRMFCISQMLPSQNTRWSSSPRNMDIYCTTSCENVGLPMLRNILVCVYVHSGYTCLTLSLCFCNQMPSSSHSSLLLKVCLETAARLLFLHDIHCAAVSVIMITVTLFQVTGFWSILKLTCRKTNKIGKETGCCKPFEL